MRKSYHYWVIHKKIFRRKWNEVLPWVREVLSNPSLHPEIAEKFILEVETEAEKLFNDPEYFYNNPDTYKVGYY